MVSDILIEIFKQKIVKKKKCFAKIKLLYLGKMNDNELIQKDGWEKAYKILWKARIFKKKQNYPLENVDEKKIT